MELIYVWIEKYKNIHQQGFNFSSRFQSEFFPIYDNGKLQDNCNFEIKENENYISNFFGNNVNVTAIVGKNGSGKSTLLSFLEQKIENRDIECFYIYEKENVFYCNFHKIKPNIITNNVEVIYIDEDSYDRKPFYPKSLRIFYNKNIGKNGLSHYYFGIYTSIYSYSLDIDRENFYNMLEARFFIPKYINIATDHIQLFDQLKQMYKFDILRLLLKNNSTKFLRKFINNELDDYKVRNFISNYGQIFCVYEKSEQVLKRIRQASIHFKQPIEVRLYDRNRKKIVSLIERIETMHRQQTSGDRTKAEKHYEFDLAILIAFIEYYLKHMRPCESSELIYQELLAIPDILKSEVFTFDNIRRIGKSYILGFFQSLKEKGFSFETDRLLTINEIIEAIQYIQGFPTRELDTTGTPYIDIPIDKNLKEHLDHIKILQKIFFEYEFDCGNEHYLRVFEYDLVNNKIGSSYESISEGEKHYILFSIDIIYYLEALKISNHTPDKEDIVFFLADEPDNAMHPIWKKKLIDNVLDIFNNYFEISNIQKHFIFTTHSPFLLSDIPKDNIIFLDTDAGQCKVLKNDEVIKKKQTFGANIHTLLSDSFFMEEGLMGDFANIKIQEVINFLNDIETNLNKEKAWNIIQIIGEPFLKYKLEEKFIEKFSTDEEKKFLRIQQLEDELRRLKNVKSED